MKPSSRFVSALAMAASLQAGCASVSDAVSSELIETEHRWVEALAQHDRAALDRLLADSFVDSTFRGATRSKRDILDGPAMSGSYRSVRLDELAVRVYASDVAIVTGVNVLQGASADDVVRVRFTDVFVKQDGRWQAVAAQETVQSEH